MSEGRRGQYEVLGGQDIILPSNDFRHYPIRAHHWQAQNPKGRILILPGFTEFCEKYAELAGFLINEGYECLIIDWPGQGRSGQLGSHPHLVHIDSFDQHMTALDEILEKTGFSEQSFSVIGHSMGGMFALLVAKHYEYHVTQAILISPMIVPRGAPVWLAVALSKLLIMLGQAKRPLPFSHIPDIAQSRKFRIDNRLTRDPEGYDVQYQIFERNPELRRAHASVGWVYACFSRCLETTLNPEWMTEVRCPVLALIAGDEVIVNLNKTREMLGYLPRVQSHLFEDARHELLYEISAVKSRVYQMIAQALNQDDIIGTM